MLSQLRGLKNHPPHAKLLQPIAAMLLVPATLPRREASSTKRRGARVAESGSLENCCPGNGTVGSIPTLSAKFQSVVSRLYQGVLADCI
jgi:hypothetical protein